MNTPIERQDPTNWYLGVFYYNISDKKLWLPKRYGWGWTLNFAQPWSWFLLAILVASIAYPFIFIQ